MVAIVSLFVVVILSILVTRVATVALTVTGLSRQSARFQARSAFTGSGFTTDEAEKVVNHPVRRKIVMLLMLLGNVGIVSAMSSLILTFVGDDEGISVWVKIGLLAIGLGVLWTLASSQWLEQRLNLFIEGLLRKYTSLDVRDYASLLRLTGEYRIVEIQVENDDWLARRMLKDSNLRKEGIAILGIRRKDGTYLGAPGGDTRIEPHDTLLAYGREKALQELDERTRSYRGEKEHREAVEEQKRVAEDEARRDEARQREEAARKAKKRHERRHGERREEEEPDEAEQDTEATHRS